MKDKVQVLMLQPELQSDLFGTEVRAANVEHVLEQIEQAAGTHPEGLDVIILPEEFLAGAGYGPLSLPYDYAEVEDLVFSKLGEAAKRHQVYIVGGVTAKLDPDEFFKSNNLGFIIGRDGVLVGIQERFHRNPVEVPYSFPGTEYRIFDLDFGKAGVILGLDILFPEVARNLVMAGAEILFAPVLNPGTGGDKSEKMRFPDDVYSCCAAARAIENQVHLVMVNGVGKFAHADMVLIGRSMAVGPAGVKMELEDSESTAVVTLSANEREQARSSYPVWEMRSKEACDPGVSTWK